MKLPKNLAPFSTRAHEANARQSDAAWKPAFNKSIQALQLAELLEEPETTAQLFHLLREQRPQAALLYLLQLAYQRVSSSSPCFKSGRSSNDKDSSPLPELLGSDWLSLSIDGPPSKQVVAAYSKQASTLASGKGQVPEGLLQVEYELILRIAAALRAALCAMATSTITSSPDPRYLLTTPGGSLALSGNMRGRFQAAVAASGSGLLQALAGHATRTLKPEDALKLEGAELAWGAFMASANSALVAASYWQRQRGAGRSQLPPSLLNTLTLDLATMCYALLHMEPLYGIQGPTQASIIWYITDVLVPALLPAITAQELGGSMLHARSSSSTTHKDGNSTFVPRTADAVAGSASKMGADVPTSTRSRGRGSSSDGSTAGSAVTPPPVHPLMSMITQYQQQCQQRERSASAASSVGNVNLTGELLSQATDAGTAHPSRLERLMASSARVPPHLRDIAAYRGLLAGLLTVCWRAPQSNDTRRHCTSKMFREDVPVIIAQKLLWPLHTSQTRPITDPAPYLKLQLLLRHISTTHTDGSTPTTTRGSSGGSSSSGHASPAISAGPEYTEGSVWSANTYALGPANAALAAVAALGACPCAQFHVHPYTPPTAAQLAGYIAVDTALSAVGCAMLQEASEPGFVDRMAADMGAICSWATTCAAMCEAASVQLDILDHILVFSDPSKAAGIPAFWRLLDNGWTVRTLYSALWNPSRCSSLAWKRGALELISPMSAAAAQLAHIALLCARTLGRLVEDPRIAECLGLGPASKPAATAALSTTAQTQASVPTSSSSFSPSCSSLPTTSSPTSTSPPSSSLSSPSSTPTSTSSPSSCPSTTAPGTRTVGGPGLQQAVAVAAAHSLHLFNQLLSLGSIILLNTETPQGNPGAQGDQQQQPAQGPPACQPSSPDQYLAPYFGRTCVSVCSWVGGLYALWPLTMASVRLCRSPSCFKRGQPLSYPWCTRMPGTCVADTMGKMQEAAFAAMSLVSTALVAGASETNTSSLAAWFSGPPATTTSPCTAKPPPCVPPQALMLRLASMPTEAWAAYAAASETTASKMEVTRLDVMAHCILPLLSLALMCSGEEEPELGEQSANSPEAATTPGAPGTDQPNVSHASTGSGQEEQTVSHPGASRSGSSSATLEGQPWSEQADQGTLPPAASECTSGVSESTSGVSESNSGVSESTSGVPESTSGVLESNSGVSALQCESGAVAARGDPGGLADGSSCCMQEADACVESCSTHDDQHSQSNPQQPVEGHQQQQGGGGDGDGRQGGDDSGNGSSRGRGGDGSGRRGTGSTGTDTVSDSNRRSVKQPQEPHLSNPGGPVEGAQAGHAGEGAGSAGTYSTSSTGIKDGSAHTQGQRRSLPVDGADAAHLRQQGQQQEVHQQQGHGADSDIHLQQERGAGSDGHAQQGQGTLLPDVATDAIHHQEMHQPEESGATDATHQLETQQPDLACHQEMHQPEEEDWCSCALRPCRAQLRRAVLGSPGLMATIERACKKASFAQLCYQELTSALHRAGVLTPDELSNIIISKAPNNSKLEVEPLCELLAAYDMEWTPLAWGQSACSDDTRLTTPASSDELSPTRKESILSSPTTPASSDCSSLRSHAPDWSGTGVSAAHQLLAEYVEQAVKGVQRTCPGAYQVLQSALARGTTHVDRT